MKTCRKCKIPRPMNCFNRLARSKDGLQPICRQCTHTYLKKRYKEKREKIRSDNRLWYLNNKERHLKTSGAWQKANPEKVSKYRKAWRLKNPNYQREWRAKNYERLAIKLRANRLIKEYNMTQQDFSTMLNKQNGQCCICKTTNPGRRGWEIDHNHSAGSVRGILCGNCNRMLGLGKDSPTVLRAGAEYLEKAA